MLSNEAIKEFQEIYEKEYGKKLTWAEASDAAWRLHEFYRILFDVAKKEHFRKLKLKDNPKGFHMEGGKYSCCICGTYVEGKSSWYDKNGIKCLLCQKAVDKKIIPSKACKDKDGWYAMWELDHYFKIKTATAKKMIREGKLNARIVPTAEGNPYYYVFMIKDNIELFGPKKREDKVTKNEDGSITIQL